MRQWRDVRASDAVAGDGASADSTAPPGMRPTVRQRPSTMDGPHGLAALISRSHQSTCAMVDVLAGRHGAAGRHAEPGRGAGPCGPDIGGISNTNGLAIGTDGTIYFTQAGSPVRMGRTPAAGHAVEPRWVTVPTGSQLWGLAVDGIRQRLYVASASGHIIYHIALERRVPDADGVHARGGRAQQAGRRPGRDVYFADSDTRIYRVEPAGDLYEVTTRAFGTNPTAGLAFAKSGELLVGNPEQRTDLPAGAGRKAGTNPTGSWGRSAGGPNPSRWTRSGRIYVRTHGATGVESTVSSGCKPTEPARCRWPGARRSGAWPSAGARSTAATCTSPARAARSAADHRQPRPAGAVVTGGAGQNAVISSFCMGSTGTVTPEWLSHRLPGPGSKPARA